MILLQGAVRPAEYNPELANIKKEYDIPAESNIRRDIKIMCNLSQGIRDDERAEIILNMHKNGFTIEQIEVVVNKNVEEVQTVIKRGEPVLA